MLLMNQVPVLIPCGIWPRQWRRWLAVIAIGEDIAKPLGYRLGDGLGEDQLDAIAIALPHNATAHRVVAQDLLGMLNKGG